MLLHFDMRLALSAALALFATGGTARAEPTCLSVADFNAFMDTSPVPASHATLTFTVTGVDPADYFNGKGWLAELGDTRCAGGMGVASLKVYGNSEPLNTAHPPGTMKLEYGSYCCSAGTCPQEYWADPNPGNPVFTSGSQVCSVVLTVDPSIVSYDITCDDQVLHHADNPNHDAMPITRAQMLSEISGGHAMTNATATSDQVCFDLAGPPTDSVTVPVTEDVTVSPDSPTTVYPYPGDLTSGPGGWTYLKFDLRSVAGRVGHATLFVHSAADASAAGDGGDVRAVAETGWSETTLTWASKPAASTSLARIGPVSPDLWYPADVSSAISAPAVYAFAIQPAATDANDAHFLSKEASTSLRPYLLLQVVAVDADGDGYFDGPDCDDGDAAVHPGAVDSCNGIDDDCDGAIDADCPPNGDSPDAGPGSDPADPDGDGGTIGGGCAAGEHGALPLGILILGAVAVLVPFARRRR